MNRRASSAWLAGVCALGALVWALGAREEGRAHVPVVVPKERTPAQRPANSTVEAPAVLRERAWAGTAADPFKPVSFEAPVVVPAVVAPPSVEPVPTAPVFPYRYFGRMTGPDGKQLTYLARGESLLLVTPGVSLEGDYRVETMNDNEIIVVYSPLNEKTVINIRATE